MISEATSHLDLTLMVAFHDAFRRDLGHLAHTASRRPADLDQPARHTAVQAGWELFTTQLHIHHTAEDYDLWPRRIGIRGAAAVVYRRIWQPRYARHDHGEPSTPA